MSPVTRIVSGLGFAEAPRWHDGRIWYVDFFSNAVERCTLDGEREMVATVEGMPGGLGFLPDGTPLVVSQREFRIYRISPDGSLSLYADLSEHCRGAANEMFVDAQGRAWVGHHGFDFFGGGEASPASLVRVDRDGSVTVVTEDLIFPNGTALLPDGKTLIVAESFANRLSAFDVDAEGSLSNRRVWADVGGHTPDGICADAEGAIWFGSPMTGAFVRVAEGGEELDRIEVGERWGVACALVGEKRDMLCMISAATTPEDMPQGKSEAFIELAKVNVGGFA